MQYMYWARQSNLMWVDKICFARNPLAIPAVCSIRQIA
ncbi:hypothetical protein EBBID32_20370 [Sphingobium indicum BiD32]|uniref:Uncharacterized protein n=1 Tax=Sphingobium indicum BiD32 TaxID=1301087 RepID=N1MLV9_9SPHN|nr:hypothetical protein EBBID32_20370 [Sphingobium indicum BiD32]